MTVASIVEYDAVLARMAALGLESLYYNSGAFGFPRGHAIHFTGWIGGEDPTLRPAARENAVRVDEPCVPTLAALASRAWTEIFPGPVWVMPKSHWAFELDFGGKEWLPSALRAAGIDPEQLMGRTNAPAVEFLPADVDRFTPLVESLLANLLGSDFALAFPDYAVTCTLHHHRQVWWTDGDGAFVRRLRMLPPPAR